MKGYVRSLSAVAVVVLAAVAGCSSSSSSGGGGSGGSVFCSFTIAGVTECSGYTNLNGDQVTAATDGCNAEPGVKIVDSCPTADLLGCCTQTSAGLNLEECYYGGATDAGATASDYQMSCTQGGGTWATSM